MHMLQLLEYMDMYNIWHTSILQHTTGKPTWLAPLASPVGMVTVGGVVRSRLSCHVPGKWGQETEGCPGVTMGSGG